MGRSRTEPFRLVWRKHSGRSVVGTEISTFLQLKEDIGDWLKKAKDDQTPNLIGAAKILRQHVLLTRKGKTAKE